MTSIAGQPGTSGGREAATPLAIAGSLLIIAGAIILLGIISSEAMYPGYSTAANAISDLGGTEPPGSIVRQPSATIFDASMILVGLLVLAAAVLLGRGRGRRSVTIALAVLGAGALGVGIFPGDTGTPHALFAMAAFIAGGVSALVAGRVVAAPFRYLSYVLGAISLLTLASWFAFGEAGPLAALGIGGLERWIVYPTVIWVTAFGGYLAAAVRSVPKAKESSDV